MLEMILQMVSNTCGDIVEEMLEMKFKMVLHTGGDTGRGAGEDVTDSFRYMR